MIEQNFTIMAAHSLYGGESLVAEARVKYKEDFPGRSARRMTHLGMMATLCVRELSVNRATPIIYASAFAESESLEKFIDSFPGASPALFQTSIHPSAVEQALIPQNNAIDRFYPITSDQNLAGKALENCLILAEDEIIVIGGEERGTWLCEFELASDSSFAFGLRLKRGLGEGIGHLKLQDRSHATASSEVGLKDLLTAIQDRNSLILPSYALQADMCLDWS